MSHEFYSGAIARLQSIGPGAAAVVLAPPSVEPTVEAARRPGTIAAVIEHDAGTVWPDRSGRQLAREALRHGGIAVLEFERLRDAADCLRRLRRAGVA